MRPVLELGQALDGVVLHVRLGRAHVEFAGLDGVHVEHRSPGRLHGAADVVDLAILVDQPADRAARRVIHAGDPTGPDRHVLLLRLRGRCSQAQGAGSG